MRENWLQNATNYEQVFKGLGISWLGSHFLMGGEKQKQPIAITAAYFNIYAVPRK